jgi:asparagine synthase (glutamine-hydrolysing)
VSAILGVFATGAGELPGEQVLHRMAAQLTVRGDQSEIRQAGGAAVAASRHSWELEEGFGGSVLVLQEGDLTLAADASLYYREDLTRRLLQRGVRPTGATPSHLVLAAYRAWGRECLDWLEGEYAFIVWDRASRTAFCARDLTGGRPLYHAVAGNSLIVASTLSAVLAHPGCAADLNPVAVAEAASGLFAASHETCYRAISWLPPASLLEWSSEQGMRQSRFWEPPVRSASTTSLANAADELQEMLCRSVAERLAPQGPTAVWLSGGYDSTAVFGAGERVLTSRGNSDHLHAISVSYPPGDPGREDERISAVVAHFGSPVHWVESERIPLFDRPWERAGRREEPFAHGFEIWNRTLTQKTRDVGARVAFTGIGGDPLFALSPIILADLFRSGRWLALAREWRAQGRSGTGWRNFLRRVVQPALHPAVLQLAMQLLGKPPSEGYLARPVAPWIDRGFARRHRLAERERSLTPPRGGLRHGDYEPTWYFTYPFAARIYALVSGLGLEGGVELRSPLLDRRIVEYALARPHRERRAGRETKRLLRAAVRDLLPAEAVAPRAFRTGLSSGYFRRKLRGQHAELFRQTFRAPRLADLGIVDATVLRERCDGYLAGRGSDATAVHLFYTLQTELWLRARDRDVPGAPEPEVTAVGAAAS